MGQGRSCLRQAQSNASISKALSKFTLREEKSGIKYATSSMQALLPRMEDARTAILDLDGSRTRSLYGVYDGLEGANVAQYGVNRFPIELLKDEECHNNWANAMGSVFFRMDEQLQEYDEWKALANPTRFNLPIHLKTAACVQGTPKFEGSTASMALIRGYQIIAGSVGDSRCVFSRNGQAMDLSTDNKPNLPDKSQRIENAGGRVTRDAFTFRCLLGQSGIQMGGYLVNGMLPMSRAIGDFHFKLNKDLHPMGQVVACDPDVLTNQAPRTPLMKKHTTINNCTSNGLLGARRLFSTKVQHVPSSEPSPENTVVVCLDGSLEDFRESYVGGLGKISELCYNNGKRVDISKIHDGHPEMFTTPSSGFFWLKLVFGQRHLFFPVIAKNLYMLGWKGGKGGAFVTKNNDDMEGYNLLEQAKMLSFSESYCDMVDDLAAVRVGPYAIREAFETLYRFRGHDHQAAGRALGIIVVNFCEAARLRRLSRYICASFSDSLVSVLGAENSERVRDYGSVCQNSMKDIDTCLTKQQPVKESTSEALAEIRIFNRSGHKAGVFKYEDPKTARSKYQRSKIQLPTFVLNDWFSSEELRKRKKSN